jgi:carbon storage regulator
MLILSRKEGESIIIDDNIEVCILEVGDGTIKIGINAPKNVKILRKEIISEVRAENIQSIKNVDDFIRKTKVES